VISEDEKPFCFSLMFYGDSPSTILWLWLGTGFPSSFNKQKSNLPLKKTLEFLKEEFVATWRFGPK
jgi:hypothetical protein